MFHLGRIGDVERLLLDTHEPPSLVSRRKPECTDSIETPRAATILGDSELAILRRNALKAIAKRTSTTVITNSALAASCHTEPAIGLADDDQKSSREVVALGGSWEFLEHKKVVETSIAVQICTFDIDGPRSSLDEWLKLGGQDNRLYATCVNRHRQRKRGNDARKRDTRWCDLRVRSAIVHQTVESGHSLAQHVRRNPRRLQISDQRERE